MTRKGVVSRYFATGLVITLATPALALSSSTYYLGLDRATHTCLVRSAPLKPGIKLMGISAKPIGSGLFSVNNL